jgi:hypothetical protein
MTTHEYTEQHTTIATTKPPSKPYTVHKIGENYGGGIVFYVYDGGQHGLIVATEDQNEGNPIRWYGGSNTITRARAEGVGAGKANTVLIIANQASVDGDPFAATVCNEYTGGGYGDWYLPSAEELGKLISSQGLGNPHPILNLGLNGPYWSSSEIDIDRAFVLSTSGLGNQLFKKDKLQVRCVRVF